MSNHQSVTLCHVSHYNDRNYTDQVAFPTLSPHDDATNVVSHERGGSVSSMTAMPAAAFDGDAAHHRLLARKAQLLEQYHMCPQSVNRGPVHRGSGEAAQRSLEDVDLQDTFPSPPSSHICATEFNKQSEEYAQTVAGTGEIVEHPAVPLAASQDLVDLFFLEGSSAVNGLCFSRYPVYGSRTAEERRAAVRAVFQKYSVEMRPPAAAATAQQAHPQRRNPSLSPASLTSPVTAGRAVAGIETREQYWRRLSHFYIRKGATAAAAAAATAAGGAGSNPAELYPHEPEDPFYMIDLGRVVEQVARWRHELPMVRPHFAVKCNPNLAIMEVLSALGAGFDCASKEEIRVVLQNGLVDSPDDIIFANPCKQLGDLRAAQACGVTYVTVDNVFEMEKIGRWMPSARAIIRIKTRDDKAVCAFSTKFGSGLEDVEDLLRAARHWNVEVYGVSFHVGSGNGDSSAYVSALRDAHAVFQQAARHGFNCTILDIGGGYPGTEPSEGSGETSFATIAGAMRPVLEELFGNGDVTIISEPGRFFTAATHALAMNVFAARKLRLSDAEKEICQASQSVVSMDEPEEYQYYINDGLYHSFNCIVYDHAHPTLYLLNDGDGADAAEGSTGADASVDSEEEAGETATRIRDVAEGQSLFLSACDRRRRLQRRPLRITTLFGPTCDSLDCILKKQPFPEMQLGDWLLAPDMGSYTTAAGCGFNGFATRRREWVSSVTL